MRGPKKRAWKGAALLLRRLCPDPDLPDEQPGVLRGQHQQPYAAQLLHSIFIIKDPLVQVSLHQWSKQGVASTAFGVRQGAVAQLHLALLQPVQPLPVGACQHLHPDDLLWPVQDHRQESRCPQARNNYARSGRPRNRSELERAGPREGGIQKEADEPLNLKQIRLLLLVCQQVVRSIATAGPEGVAILAKLTCSCPCEPWPGARPPWPLWPSTLDGKHPVFPVNPQISLLGSRTVPHVDLSL
ncbi:uncharacterized protein [Desmodus rotundus]|uniref:uncharacterized protein n=1 Tax=Desmodus rotundus TaxID=9430 RepID=UPI0039E21D7D